MINNHNPVASLRIAAVTLVVPDYDAAIAWYCGRADFVLLTDVALGDGKRWVTVAPPGGSGASLLLARAADETQAAAIGNQTGGRVAFFLETDDFGATWERFSAAGVQFLEPPRTESYGTVAVFVDPFGNKWDLIQPR